MLCEYNSGKGNWYQARGGQAAVKSTQTFKAGFISQRIIVYDAFTKGS